MFETDASDDTDAADLLRGNCPGGKISAQGPFPNKFDPPLPSHPVYPNEPWVVSASCGAPDSEPAQNSREALSFLDISLSQPYAIGWFRGENQRAFPAVSPLTREEESCPLDTPPSG